MADEATDLHLLLLPRCAKCILMSNVCFYTDWNESQFSSKKGDETSDEEREWLDALEAGRLDDNGELKKQRDTSMLTARQVI